MERRRNNWLPITVIILFILILAGGYYFLGQNQKYISPVPPKTSFQVIYYTPTPEVTIPTSSPSATPKVKATVVPTKAQILKEASVTATPKLTITARPTQ